MEHLVAKPECMHVLTSFVTPGTGSPGNACVDRIYAPLPMVGSRSAGKRRSQAGRRIVGQTECIEPRGAGNVGEVKLPCEVTTLFAILPAEFASVLHGRAPPPLRQERRKRTFPTASPRSRSRRLKTSCPTGVINLIRLVPWGNLGTKGARNEQGKANGATGADEAGGRGHRDHRSVRHRRFRPLLRPPGLERMMTCPRTRLHR